MIQILLKLFIDSLTHFFVYNPKSQLRAGGLGSVFNPVSCLLSLLLVAGCNSKEWDSFADNIYIYCEDGEKPAIFSYNVTEQGIQFPGMSVMLRRDIPKRVQQLWVTENQFLVIWAGRALHCDNFDENGRILGKKHCKNPRTVTGYHMIKYDHDRLRYWPMKSTREFIAEDIDFEPSEKANNIMTGCKQSTSIRQKFADLEYSWVELQRQF